jgi:hypothetical protein
MFGRVNTILGAEQCQAPGTLRNGKEEERLIGLRHKRPLIKQLKKDLDSQQ